jgi:hypothetical protein
MAISNGFWPLNLSVESLVLREMVPDYQLPAGGARPKTQLRHRAPHTVPDMQ